MVCSSPPSSRAPQVRKASGPWACLRRKQPQPGPAEGASSRRKALKSQWPRGGRPRGAVGRRCGRLEQRRGRNTRTHRRAPTPERLTRRSQMLLSSRRMPTTPTDMAAVPQPESATWCATSGSAHSCVCLCNIKIALVTGRAGFCTPSSPRFPFAARELCRHLLPSIRHRPAQGCSGPRARAPACAAAFRVAAGVKPRILGPSLGPTRRCALDSCLACMQFFFFSNGNERQRFSGRLGVCV